MLELLKRLRRRRSDGFCGRCPGGQKGRRYEDDKCPNYRFSPCRRGSAFHQITKVD
ncbi:MAG: hypothetical protein QM775_31445 [Pirellulales bacterium]